MHHANAGRDRRRGAPTRDIAQRAIRVSNLHATAVGCVHPAENPHERRLSRAILADERMDLATGYLERRAAIRLHCAERLMDVGEPDGGPARQRHHRVAGTMIWPSTICCLSASTRVLTVSGMSLRFSASYTYPTP